MAQVGMASSSQKPVMVTAVTSLPEASITNARNSPRETGRSGSKKYWFPILQPVKIPSSASSWAAAAAGLGQDQSFLPQAGEACWKIEL